MIEFESTRGAGAGYREAYDGDSDDDEPSGHRVGCAHQQRCHFHNPCEPSLVLPAQLYYYTASPRKSIYEK